MALTKKQELELTRLLALEAKVQASRHYYKYVRYTHSAIYTYTKHGEFICNVLNEAVEKRLKMFAGEIPIETQYFMFTMPSQHGKSMHITETFPSYFLGKFPQHGCIEVSYNEDFASKFGKRNREKVDTYGKDLFDISLPKDDRSTSEWGLVYKGKRTRGGMISRGILSGITGSSLGDLLIMDDVVKNSQEASSESTRESHWNEWTDSISKRIHPGAIVILIMTRWHENDLAGRLLDKEYGQPLPWKVYNFPIECDEYHIEKEGNPLNREIGEPLWPEMYGVEDIARRKQYLKTFNAMDQGRPTAAEGNILKRSSWNYYDARPEFINKIPMIILSVDAAFKDTKDPVGIHVWGKHMANYYLIDRINERLDFTATIQAIRNMLKKYPTLHLKLIEDKANGSAIINVLNKEIGGFIPVQPYGNKVSRVNAVLPYIDSGNVYLPQKLDLETGKLTTLPWVHEFVEQCAAFPNGSHDKSLSWLNCVNCWKLLRAC